jgi:hypothetical protein
MKHRAQSKSLGDPGVDGVPELTSAAPCSRGKGHLGSVGDRSGLSGSAFGDSPTLTTD